MTNFSFIFQIDTDNIYGVVREHFAVVYHFEKGVKDSYLKVPMFGTVTQFKVTKHYIGVESKASRTPFLTWDSYNKKIRIFWIECDTFSFDCTRKFIYYNVNKSIFQYDLNKSRYNKFEVRQKIAIDAISNGFSLTPINDRFLLVRSLTPNAYDLFDVIDHVPVKSIQLKKGFSLVHVGRLSIVFGDSKNFLIFRFH